MNPTFNLTEKFISASERALTSDQFLSGTTSLGYGQARDMIGQSCALFEQRGLRPGDRIAVITQSVQSMAVLYLAGLSYGACMVVLDPHASASELIVLLEHAKVSAIFADDAVISRTSMLTQNQALTLIPIAEKPKRSGFGLLKRASKKVDETSYPSLLAALPTDTVVEQVSDAEPAVILFTSGSTSIPKGVVLSRKAIAVQMDIFISRFDLSPKSRVVNHLPMHHTDGLNQGPLLMWMSGGTLLLPPAVNTQSVGLMLDMVFKDRATHLITVPTVLAMIARLDDSYDDSFSASEFRFIESTAGPISPAMWEDIETRFKVRVVNCYGLTETVSEAFYCGPDDAFYKRGTIGKPDGFTVQLAAEDGSVTDTGPGELQLKGDSLLTEYFNNPEATKEAFTQDGWFRTGDLAACDPDGYYSIVGRLKNVIIRASVNIYPDDLNHAAGKHASVRDVATYGVADDMLGERVVMCVTGDTPDSEKLRVDLFNHLRTELADEKIPNDIFVIETMPYGPSGKPELKKIEEIVQRLEPESENESLADKVFAAAAASFGVSKDALSASDGPDQVPGWDSLNFLQFIMRIERRFDLAIAPRDIMGISTIGDVVEIVKNK